MTVRLFPSPIDFAPVAHWVYRRDPVTFTLELTTLHTAHWPADRVLASVRRDGALGAAVQGADGCLLVSGLPTGLAATLFAEAADALRGVPSVRGTRGAADEFANSWAAETGGRPEQTRADVLYRLDELVPPSGVPGAPRAITASDTELVVDWLDGFFAESQREASDRLQRARFLQGALDDGSRIVLWEVDGTPVSMARVHPPAAAMTRIGPVFTPVEQRGHGFAAAATAAAATLARRLGARDVVLFADVANPVSNRVYRRIGFRPVTEMVGYALRLPASG